MKSTRSVLECGGPPPLFSEAGDNPAQQSSRRLAQPAPDSSGSTTWRPLLAFCILQSAVCLLAPAQDYSIDWWTVDGGGGTTSDGVYEVSGTIGQPDAGIISVNGYTIDGGFWSDIAAVQVPGAPWLTIERLSANSVRVSWPGPTEGFVLQECLAAGMSDGHWANVSATPQTVNERKEVIVTPLAGHRLYRLSTTTAPPLSVVPTDTNTVVISWPAPSTGWILQECFSLATFDWVYVSVLPQVVNGTNQVVLPFIAEVPWYRLVGLPRLSIEKTLTNGVVVAWPASATGCVLQECLDVESGLWVDVASLPQIVGERNQVVITPLAGQRFYRLAPFEAPRLHIAVTDTNTVIVAWPYPSSGFSLQQNTDAATTNWTAVPNVAVHISNEWQVVVSPTAGNRFYRLLKP